MRTMWRSRESLDWWSKMDSARHPLADMLLSGRAVLLLGDCTFEGDNPGALDRLREKLAMLLAVPDWRDIDTETLITAAEGADKTGTSAAVSATLLTAPYDRPSFLQIVGGPWQRIYSLSSSGIRTVAHDQLRAPLTPTSIRHGFSLRPTPQLIDMTEVGTGELSKTFVPPEPTQSGPRYNWYKQFAADAVSRPIIVFCTRPHRELWKYVEVRKASGDVELSPALLICEKSSPIDMLLARSFRMNVLQMDMTTFGAELSDENDYVVSARGVLARSVSMLTNATGPLLVASLTNRTEKVEPTWDFLRGYDPKWADVVGPVPRVAELSMFGRIASACRVDNSQRNVVVLRGKAGSGKTTALMRLAVLYQTRGLVVVWIDRRITESVGEIVRDTRALQPDVVMVDDADIFGESTAGVLAQLNAEGKTLVLASIRRTMMWTLAALPGTVFVEGDERLQDPDLEAIGNALDRAGLLGSLEATKPSARAERLRILSERDLLAALIQVVTGQKFEERIRSEYQQLNSKMERLAYAVLAFQASFVFEETSVPRESLIQMLASGPPYVAAIESIALLQERRLIVEDVIGLRVRHRAIADGLVTEFDAEYRKRLLTLMLDFYVPRSKNLSNSDPIRRNMISLISHNMMKKLSLPVASVREIYGDLHSDLKSEYHYWLQRGAYEVEKGSLDLADTYLEASRSFESGARDYRVTTEWGLMRILKAIRSPEDRSSQERAIKAFDQLSAVTKVAGSLSPHTFSIMVKDGVEWLEAENVLPNTERERLISKLRDARDLGERFCMGNREFASVLSKFSRRVDLLAEGRKQTGPYPII